MTDAIDAATAATASTKAATEPREILASAL